MTSAVLTAAQVAAVAPTCDARIWSGVLNSAAADFGIDTPKRATAWLAQIAHESAGFTRLSESLNYSAEGLLATFSRARISATDCRRLGRIGPAAAPTQKANQQAIANLVYGGQWGALNLGNRKPGDGWLYRGRGVLQTSGRANCLAAGKRLGLDLVADPGQLATPAIGARAAAAFWVDHGLNQLADAGNQLEITERINGGQNGADDRARLLALATSAIARA